MENHPQNPEFKNNPENFHQCIYCTVGNPRSYCYAAINISANGDAP